ncbi:unnamed protein product [Rotaria sp. Silwood1]|nr:unnamed protein product [Rotaria sp. Silwood1]CAF3566267.1 unnamed protein product [Rotaria sp. Silwood1]CAF4861655.1 unnamed protein product [Rotaria sp. Silwood1]
MNNESKPAVHRRRRRRSIIREFCLNTSTHALPGIARSESMHNRLFWSISFVIFTGIMIYFVTISIINYFQYPTTIDVSYDNDWQQYFAAFSFCNIAPFRSDRFIEPFLNYTNALNLTDTNDTTTITPYQANFVDDFIFHKINSNETLEDYFFPLSSMLFTCSYNFQSCSTADFISFISPTYGLCHTFNAKWKNTSENSLRRGSAYGSVSVLTLGLYIHSYQYLPYLSEVTGITALVHDNTQIPNIDSNGIELEPGRRHRIGYRRKRAKFLSSPYTDCANKISRSFNAMLENYNQADYNYSQTDCLQVCLQTYVYEKCGCINPYLWNIRSIVLPGTDKVIFAPICNSSNDCFSTASDELFTSATYIQNYCSDCSQECVINSFALQTTSSMLNIDWKLESIKNFVENSTVSLPNNWSTTWQQHIYENYLIVNVISESHIIETNTQISSLGIVDVISNIGGHTGLWIGISFLSIMEFIEMIYRLIRYQLHLIRESQQRKINIIQP